MEVKVDLGDNTTRLIEQLATQLNMTVDKVFPWYVEMILVKASLSILFTGITLIILIIMFFMAGKKIETWSTPEPTGWQIICIVCAVSVIVVGIIALSTGSNTVSQLFIPEPYAIKVLVSDAGRLLGK